MMRFPAFLALGFFSMIALAPANDYPLGLDSQIKEGVPRGKVEQRKFTASKIFPGTERDYWVYVPAQYDGKEPAALMVFQDGGGYVGEKGNWRVPVVLDNLIAAKQMPVTIGVFVNPGVVPAPNGEALPRFNRSFEYDGLGSNYVRFLTEELLPEALKGLNVSADPNLRGIGGASSGAIAAFTAAWENPGAFRRVFSTIGTYVDLRGGGEYPNLIRKFEPKPLRVFLQDGDRDLNIYGGDWWIANQAMLSALTFSGYEVNHVWGKGGHNGEQGGPILPDALRWLWQDWQKGVAVHPDQSKQPLNDVLVAGEDWQAVEGEYTFTDGPAVGTDGAVYVSDMGSKRILKIGEDGKATPFAETPAGLSGLEFGPDGKLYGTSGALKKLVRLTTDGKWEDVAEGVGGNDLAINQKGAVYVTLTGEKSILRIQPDGTKDIVAKDVGSANGISFSSDQSLLYTSDHQGTFTWSFQVAADGKLQHAQRYFYLHKADAADRTSGDGMTVDKSGRVYITTEIGIQVCDQPGRVNFIIRKPSDKGITNVAFGGKEFDTLYITAGDKIFRRKTKTKGVLAYQAPVLPPKPNL